MSKELDICDDRRRRELADSILSILYRRFRWMDRDPTAWGGRLKHRRNDHDKHHNARLRCQPTH